jgi:hypothetical protein
VISGCSVLQNVVRVAHKILINNISKRLRLASLHHPLKSSHERRQLLTIPPLAQTQVLPIEDYGDVMVIPPAFDLTALTLHHLCSFRSDRSTMQLLRSADHRGDDLSNIIS